MYNPDEELEILKSMETADGLLNQIFDTAKMNFILARDLYIKCLNKDLPKINENLEDENFLVLSTIGSIIYQSMMKNIHHPFLYNQSMWENYKRKIETGRDKYKPV